MLGKLWEWLRLQASKVVLRLSAERRFRAIMWKVRQEEMRQEWRKRRRKRR